MFCHKCGTKAIDGALFCQKCGAKLIKEEAVQMSAEPEPRPEEKAVSLEKAVSEPVRKAVMPEETVSRTDVNTYQPSVSFNSAPEEVIPHSDVNTSQPNANYDSTDGNADTNRDGDTDICSLLKNNIGMCLAIKSAKKTNIKMINANTTFIILKSRFCKYSAAIGSDTIAMSSSLSIPIYVLFSLPFFILNIIDSSIGFNDDAEYWAFALLIFGIENIIYSFAGRKEKADIAEYVRKNAESCGFTMKSTEKPVINVIRRIAAIVMILAGLIILLIPVIQDNFIYDDNENTYDTYYETEYAEYFDETAGDPEADSNEVLLSQTYNNEEEGFSFMYPSDWENDNEELAAYGDSGIVCVSKSGLFGTYAYILVSKEKNDDTYFETTKSDWENYLDDYFKNVEVTEFKDDELDGHYARKLTYTFTKDNDVQVITTKYFYTVGSDVYIVSGGIAENWYETLNPVFEDIIDSYNITASASASAYDTPVSDTLVSDAPVSNTPVYEKDPDDDVRIAYVNKIKELEDEYGEYSNVSCELIDFTANDVYELVVYSDDNICVYAYDNGNVISITEGWDDWYWGGTSYEYLPCTGIVKYIYGDVGRTNTDYKCVEPDYDLSLVYGRAEYCDLESIYGDAPEKYTYYYYDHYGNYYYYVSGYYGNYYSTAFEDISKEQFDRLEITGSFIKFGANGGLAADEMKKSLNNGAEVRGSYPGEVIFNGIPIKSFYDIPIECIIRQWGDPLSIGDFGEYRYNGIDFYVDSYTERINDFSMSPKMCTFNGVTLNKTHDELDAIFGITTPYDRGFHYDDYSVYFSMNSDSDLPDSISFYPY